MLRDLGIGSLDADVDGPYVVRPRPSDLAAYSVLTQVLGPSHDPSIRAIYEVWMDDGTRGDADGPGPTVQLISCALAGTTIRIEGSDMPRPRHMDEARWSRFAEWTFEAVTGVRPSDLDVWSHGGPEDETVRDAERAAGWDPNP